MIPPDHRDRGNRADPYTEPNSCFSDFSDSLNSLNSLNSMKVLLHLEKTPMLISILVSFNLSWELHHCDHKPDNTFTICYLSWKISEEMFLQQCVHFKVENVQRERLRILHSKCPKNKSRLRISNNILVDDKHKFIMCYITKVTIFWGLSIWKIRSGWDFCYVKSEIMRSSLLQIASTSWRVKLAAQNSTHIPDFYSIRRNFSRTMQR